MGEAKRRKKLDPIWGNRKGFGNNRCQLKLLGKVEPSQTNLPEDISTFLKKIPEKFTNLFAFYLVVDGENIPLIATPYFDSRSLEPILNCHFFHRPEHKGKVTQIGINKIGKKVNAQIAGWLKNNADVVISS